MKQPANSCEVRKGCVVFGTECRGEEEKEERGVKLENKRRAKRKVKQDEKKRRRGGDEQGRGEDSYSGEAVEANFKHEQKTAEKSQQTFLSDVGEKEKKIFLYAGIGPLTVFCSCYI